MLKTTAVGNYPKITEDKKEINLRVIKEQEAAGVDLITDGQIRWDDLITPFAKNIRGMEIGGLLRFFDNNIYYRRPIVKSKLSFGDYSVVKEFKFVKANSSKDVKAVIPGAFTFAQLSSDDFYHDEEKIVFDLARILHREAEKLSQEGAEIIQIDEPYLCFHPEGLGLVKESLKIITEGIKAKFALYLYFGSIKKLVPDFFDLPVDILGIDLVSKKENLDLLLDYNGKKEIGLGCVDARNTMMEKQFDLIALFEKITKKYSGDQIFVNPSCGLEFLPHADAQKKLKNMVEAVKKFNG